MNLLDDYSALHNFKQRHGLNQVANNNASAFILECQLRRILENTIQSIPINELAQESGLEPYQIDEIVYSQVLTLQKPQLADGIALCENEGVSACLCFLFDLQS